MMKIDYYVKKERKGLLKKITSMDYRVKIKDLLTESNIEKIAMKCAFQLDASYRYNKIIPNLLVFEIEINTGEDYNKAKDFFHSLFRTQGANLNMLIKESKYFIIDVHTIERTGITRNEAIYDIAMFSIYLDGIENEVKLAFGKNFEFRLEKNYKIWDE